MAKLHRFSQSVEPITITDSDDELDIVKDRVQRRNIIPKTDISTSTRIFSARSE